MSKDYWAPLPRKAPKKPPPPAPSTTANTTTTTTTAASAPSNAFDALKTTNTNPTSSSSAAAGPDTPKTAQITRPELIPEFKRAVLANQKLSKMAIVEVLGLKFEGLSKAETRAMLELVAEKGAGKGKVWELREGV